MCWRNSPASVTKGSFKIVDIFESLQRVRGRVGAARKSLRHDARPCRVADPDLDLALLDVPINAVATALKQFLNELSESVIPSFLHDDLMEVCGERNHAPTRLSASSLFPICFFLILLIGLNQSLPPGHGSWN